VAAVRARPRLVHRPRRRVARRHVLHRDARDPRSGGRCGRGSPLLPHDAVRAGAWGQADPARRTLLQPDRDSLLRAAREHRRLRRV